MLKISRIAIAMFAVLLTACSQSEMPFDRNKSNKEMRCLQQANGAIASHYKTNMGNSVLREITYHRCIRN